MIKFIIIKLRHVQEKVIITSLYKLYWILYSKKSDLLSTYNQRLHNEIQRNITEFLRLICPQIVKTCHVPGNKIWGPFHEVGNQMLANDKSTR